MQKIIPPISPNATGNEVSNLQDALLFLLSKKIFKAYQPPNTPTEEELHRWTEMLKKERVSSLFGEGTYNLVFNFQLQQGLGDNLRGLVEEKTAATLNDLLTSLGAFDDTANGFLVKGIIRLANGAPYEGLTVRAFDKDLRIEELIGEAITDENGSYEIRYTYQHISNAEQGGADILVRVLEENGNLLATSDIFYNAPAEQIINLTIFPGHEGQPSEWEIIQAQLWPLLKNQKKASRGKYTDLPPGELEGADIEFLHYDTGIEINHIRCWALAHRRALQVVNIPAEAFYGWLREGLQEQPEKLWDVSTEELINQLKQAITDKIIPVSVEDLLEQIKAIIEQIRTDIENKPLLEKAAAFTPDFGNRQDLSDAFTKIYLDHKGDWLAIKPQLTNSTTFPKEIADKLFFTQDLSDWSDHNDVVMATFKKDSASNSLWDIGLNFNKPALSDKVPASAVPATETKETFTNYLYNGLFANEPTAVVINMINDPKVPLWNDEGGSFVSGVLSKNPEFNIKTTSVNEVTNNKDLLKDVPEAKKEQVIKDIKTLQRVTLLSPVPEAVPALINNNYVSAYTITEFPPAQFIATMNDTGLPEETLAHIYAEAENRNVFNEQTLIKIKEAGEKTGIRLIDGEFGNHLSRVAPETEATLTKNNLSWDLLFGDADFCECGECTSVYSAAAYFVDLLQYLRNNNIETKYVRPDPKDYTNTPLQKLFARRPDLGHLELSCKNTNTILPYVDLVNEVMEQYVAYKTTKAFNVTDETSGELLSAPQHTEQEHAYQILKEAVFPFTLPYHQPMDAARIFLHHLNSSRYELMNTFQAARDPKKAIEPTKEGGELSNNDITYNTIPSENEKLDRLYDDYLQRGIDAEYLNINPEEYFILTKEVFVSKEYWDTQFFVGGSHGIHTIEEYQNKIGIIPLEKYYGYDSKANLLSTDEAKKIGLTFVKAQFLPRTGIVYTDLITLLKTQFINPTASSGGITIVGGPVVLTNTGTCNLDEVRLMVGTSQLAEGRYDKIHRFIRLWRRLGFTMDETDKAIMALGNGNITPALIHQLASVKKIMNLTGIELIKLLCLWGDISTTGDNALYQRLFLSHNVLAMDDIFKADNTGAYLTGAPQKISAHLPSVMAALNVSADDIASIQAYNSMPDELTITNLSILYRYRLLSKVVGLRIPAFVHVLPLFSNPFSHADATLQFLETWTAIENTGFTPQQLNFIIRDVDDERNPFTPSQKSMLQVTKTLYDGLNAIDQLHQDLQQINMQEQSSIELVRTKASLLTDTGTVEKIIGLLEGTTEFTTNAPKNLDITVPDTQTLKKKLKYDKTLGSIQITGILTKTEHDDYEAFSSNNGSWSAALLRIEKQQAKLFKELLSGIFENEKNSIDAATKAQLKATIQAGDISFPVDKIPQGQEDTNTAEKKRMAFLKIYLPYLRQELSRRFVVDTLSGFTGSDAEITDVLISEVLTSGTPAVPIYNIFEKIKESSKPVESNWEGYLVPATEAVYTFIVSNSDTKPDIRLDGVALNFTVQEDPTNEWWSAEVRLKAGKLYPLTTVDVPLKNLFWKTPASSIAPVPSSALIPDFASKQCEPALIALQKAAMLVSAFVLSSDEIRFLNMNKADFDNLNFNELTLTHWLRMEAYTRLRNSLPQPKTNILDFWKWIHDTSTSETGLGQKIAELTLWEKENIENLISPPLPRNFNLSKKDFKNEKNLLKLQQAIAVAAKTGMDIGKLFEWAQPIADFDTSKTIADSIQKAIRAQYNQTDWEQVIKPLNDQLRNNQKNALIVYLLQQKELKDAHVIDADGLFEYFLIDVQMDTCMETSRIKQAISSVQLFIQRCFLGLEESIAPSRLDRNRWEWMERYRVWEANRKVFLYPENWIESNLRDDKSPFFKELESELLQKDINKQTVTDALKTYLYKVDEVANMEVVGLYMEGEKTKDFRWSEGAKLHVFSRTRNAPYFFYYRYLALDEMNWYPWEKMQVDIPSYDVEDPVTHKITGNGCYLTPVVWNGRLLIFFPQFMKKTKPNDKASGNIKHLSEQAQNELKPIEYWEIKMAWSEYRNGKWTQKQLSKNAIYDDGVSSIVEDENLAKKRTDAKNSADAAAAARIASDKALVNLNQALNDYLDSLYIEYWYPTYVANLSIKLFYAPTLAEKSAIAAEMTPDGHRRYIKAAKDNQLIAYNNWDKKLKENIDATDKLKLANKTAETAANAYNEALKNSYTANTIADISKFRFVPVFSNDNVNDKLLGIKVFNGSIERSIFEFNGSQITNKTKSYLGNTDNDLTIFHHKTISQWGIVYIRPFQDDPDTDEDNHSFMDETSTTYVIYRNHPINFHHPYTHRLIGNINSGNVNSFFKSYYDKISIEDRSEIYGFYDFDQFTKPDIFHELKRPYSLYNWELFFHTPIMLADALSKAQQFEEAMKWFHYVFNPIAEGEDDQRFWQFAPFKEIDSKSILEKIFNSLKGNTPNDAINEWRNNPFKPHLVARSRPVAYMKWVVMKYIDNILDWGDYLFRQDTLESINQATHLYVLAGHILGPRPMMIPKSNGSQAQTYLSLLDKWDAFSNAMSELEVVAVYSIQSAKEMVKFKVATPTANIFGSASALYFCIPKNPKLLGYWDTLADRLFKIRHCQNIEGIFRKLPLFEPPIDPALLVKAAAQGLSISSVINDLNTATPNYRFYYLLQKALELCNEVKSLGGAMLSAIEKKDNEAMSLLRARHEGTMNNLMMEIKKLQLEEAQKSLDSLYQNRKAPEARMKYYLQLIGEDADKIPGFDNDFSELPNTIEKPVDVGGLKLIKYEKEDMDLANASAILQLMAGIPEALASILFVIPQMAADVKPLGLGAGATFGGTNLGQLTQSVSKGLQIAASHLSHQSVTAAKKGGFQRALQERIMQANATGYELKQIDKQITAQQIRLNITNQEIINQQKQIDNANEVEEFLKNKYTNEELYTWMRGSLKTLYRQVYNLAYDLAKKAEKTYCFERGISNATFIQAGYFDAGREGLLAGEQLFVGLKQLEAAYQEKRGYDYEITKHISLRQLNPMALLQLKAAGTCEFDLPEWLFDVDYSGHFKRRIKSVSVSIPCIAGPYTGVNATLRLLNNRFRNSSMANKYPEKADEPDDRFISYNIPITAIATSSAQNDAGMFELNFKDERYLPFEGAGVISRWRLELPTIKQFDYNTISDVVLHVKYTASEGGEQLKNSAIGSVNNFMKAASEQEGLLALIDLKHDMPNEWTLFVKNGNTNISIDPSRLPYMAQALYAKKASNVKIENVMFVAKVKDNPPAFPITVAGTATNLSKIDGWNVWQSTNSVIKLDTPFTLEGQPVQLNILEELIMVVKYSLTEK